MTRAGALAYARSLWASGYRLTTISRALSLDVALDDDKLSRLARAKGWARHTPVRPHAELSLRMPVTVRCGSCFAVYGDVAGEQRRPCPRCQNAQLVLPGTGRCWTLLDGEARAA